MLIKLRVSPRRLVRALTLFAVFLVPDGFLVWQSPLDGFAPLQLAGRSIMVSTRSALAAADDRADQNTAQPASTLGEADFSRDVADRTLDVSVRETSDLSIDWQERLHARLSVVESRIAVARAATARVKHDVESEKEIDLTELKLQIATRNRDRYTRGESERERASLKNQVRLARDRHRQLEERVAWSKSLANGGLISQAALDIDVSAAKGSESELRAAEDRLTVFETIDRERSQIQLEVDVQSARAEFELLKQNAKSVSQELRKNYLAEQQTLETVRSREELMNEGTTVDPEPVKIDPLMLARMTKNAKLARSAMLRAEQELAAVKQQADVAVQNGRRLHKVRKLKLKAFLRGQQSGTLHELSIRIRTITERLTADQQQLSWARRVVRKGYITESELRKAELAVSRRQAELTNVQQQKSILTEHTLQRDRFELTARLHHASKELVRQERLADAQIEEFTVTSDARRQAWKIHQEVVLKTGRQRKEVLAEAGGG